LIVDDNAANLNVAQGLLRICQITVETAISGNEALKLVKKNDYDLIFMDQRMPEMSGIEATIALRESGINIPIIALTASIIHGTQTRMIEAGMNDYLSKPIIKTELMAILKKWLPADKLTDPPSDPVSLNNADSETREDFWEKIEQIGELSVSTGLGQVDGQRDVYETTLRLMIQEIEKSIKTLPAFLSVENIDDFIIEIHGIKGALANIGAIALSEKSYALEKKSETGDLDFCAGHLPPLLEELSAFVTKLKEAFSSINSNGVPVDIPPELPHIFEKMITAFSEVDLVSIDSECENLAALNLNSALREKTGHIRDAIMMMDYDGAEKMIQELLATKNICS
jgi:CheY-like chemotaxis protein/HPt (histidine-containing phosphotransfer) domain-containing protein